MNDIIFTLAKNNRSTALTFENPQSLRTTSLPIPFKSPIEINIIFSAFFIITSGYLLLILKCKFSKIKQEMFTGIIETLGTIQEIKKRQQHYSGLFIQQNSKLTKALHTMESA
jgi:hypothetical protein